MTVTFVFALPNVTDAINDPSGFPVMYVFRQAMPTEGVIIITVMMIFLLLIGDISAQASTARQTFAFARDGGLPFSKWISKVGRNTVTPL